MDWQSLLPWGKLKSDAVLDTCSHCSRWNSYNHYSCQPNESIIRSNAQALVDLGLADLGYHYVTTDCGWTVPNRTADGTLTWNQTLFPSGFPATGAFIHSLGLGFGVYSDSGIRKVAFVCSSDSDIFNRNPDVRHTV